VRGRELGRCVYYIVSGKAPFWVFSVAILYEVCDCNLPEIQFAPLTDKFSLTSHTLLSQDWNPGNLVVEIFALACFN
jgi:hypothetical protein